MIFTSNRYLDHRLLTQMRQHVELYIYIYKTFDLYIFYNLTYFEAWRLTMSDHINAHSFVIDRLGFYIEGENCAKLSEQHIKKSGSPVFIYLYVKTLKVELTYICCRKSKGVDFHEMTYYEYKKHVLMYYYCMLEYQKLLAYILDETNEKEIMHQEVNNDTKINIRSPRFKEFRIGYSKANYMYKEKSIGNDQKWIKKHRSMNIELTYMNFSRYNIFDAKKKIRGRYYLNKKLYHILCLYYAYLQQWEYYYLRSLLIVKKVICHMKT